MIGYNLKKHLFRKSHPLFVFHHIPKCGGTSVRDVISQWFTVIPDYRPSVKLTEPTVSYLENPKDIKKYGSGYCLCSHFELPDNHLGIRYPGIFKDPSRYKVFTFLRDPLELNISLYYYQIKTGRRDPQNEPLDDFLLKQRNYIANRIPCNSSNYKDVLAKYYFIGLNEFLQESLDLLAELIKKPPVQIGRMNVSDRDDQDLNLSENTKQVFRSNNMLDYMIYDYARENYFAKYPDQIS